MLLLCTFLLLGFVLLVFCLREKIRCIYYLNKLNGPAQIPLLGNAVDFVTAPVPFFKILRAWSKEYGPLYLLSASIFFPAANVSGAEQLEKIISTTKNIEKSKLYLFFDRWLGEGLLTSKGSKWHTRRKILTPAFHFNILQQFVSVFNKETKTLVEVLDKEAEKPWTNVVPIISLFTLCAIAETSMGTPLNMDTDEDKEYILATIKIGKVIYYRLMRPWTYFQSIFYNFLHMGLYEKKLVNILHTFTDSIIAKRAKTFEKFEVTNNDEIYNYSRRKKLAFLDLLLNAKVSQGIIDDTGIKDEVNTFMFEGHDTTSMSICFTLMLLANYKDYQDQVYQEMIAVIPDNDKDPDINDLNELKLMERVIKESLRLYPSVPFISRTLEEDTMVDGYLLPKEGIVHIHIFDIHRNEKDWPDPEKFDPDRFLPDNCSGRHPFAYVPFSAGPRNCIGQKFAMLELKAVLYGILKKFILEPIDTRNKIMLVPDMVLRPDQEMIRVKFSKRNTVR